MIQQQNAFVSSTLPAWDGGKIASRGWRAPAGGAADVLDKASGERLARVGLANATDVAEACKRARDASGSWSATAPAERAAILRKARRSSGRGERGDR